VCCKNEVENEKLPLSSQRQRNLNSNRKKDRVKNLKKKEKDLTNKKQILSSDIIENDDKTLSEVSSSHKPDTVENLTPTEQSQENNRKASFRSFKNRLFVSI